MSLLAHPVRLFLVACLVCLAAERIPVRWRRSVAPIATSGSVAAILAMALFAGWYVVQPTYYDWIEPSVTSVGWAWLHGAEIYPPLDSWLRYGHAYGPLTFIVQSAAFAMFGPSLAVSKAVGVGAMALALIGLFRACRRHASPVVCIWLVGLLAGLCLTLRNVGFWNRPDPLLILAASVAVLACEAASVRNAVLLAAVALAATLDLKVTSVVCLLPALVVLWRRFGVRPVLLAGSAGIVAALAVFALPHVSLAGFVAMNETLRRHGLPLLLVWQNLKWALWLVALLIPALAAGSGREHIVEFTATGVALLLAAMTGAHPTSGVHHFLPVVPAILWQIARTRVLEPDSRRRFGVGLYVAAGFTWLVMGSASIAGVVADVDGRVDRGLARDATDFADAHDMSRIVVGYGSTAEPAFVVPVLLFRGSPFVIEALTVFETDAAGIPMSPATLEALRSCRADAWLLPQGEPPFSLHNAYFETSQRRAFDEGFRHAFLDAYVRKGPATSSFDLWICRVRREAARSRAQLQR